MVVRPLIICRAECGQDRPSRGGTGPHGSGVLGIQIRERRSQFELRRASTATAPRSLIEAFRFIRADVYSRRTSVVGLGMAWIRAPLSAVRSWLVICGTLLSAVLHAAESARPGREAIPCVSRSGQEVEAHRAIPGHLTFKVLRTAPQGGILMQEWSTSTKRTGGPRLSSAERVDVRCCPGHR